MDRLHFFFSFELSYLRTPQKPRLVGLRGFTLITPCHRHHHCAEWSCVVLSRWSRHRNGSGRDWPHKATMRRLGLLPRASIHSSPDQIPLVAPITPFWLAWLQQDACDKESF